MLCASIDAETEAILLFEKYITVIMYINCVHGVASVCLCGRKNKENVHHKFNQILKCIYNLFE